jgi:hypothetical protein
MTEQAQTLVRVRQWRALHTRSFIAQMGAALAAKLSTLSTVKGRRIPVQGMELRRVVTLKLREQSASVKPVCPPSPPPPTDSRQTCQPQPVGIRKSVRIASAITHPFSRRLADGISSRSESMAFIPRRIAPLSYVEADAR